jgi:hypothetical protein
MGKIVTTFSFNYTLAPAGIDTEPPEAGYTVTLQGNAGEPTRFEINSVIDNTARAALALTIGKATQGTKFEIDEKRGTLDHLRSTHYTWNVVRNDGQPMLGHELQAAMLEFTMLCMNEPVYSIPRSTLDTLLSADKSLSQALADAIRDAAPLQREVQIHEPEVAAGLVKLGLISPSGVAGEYVLLDIEVR